MLAKRVSTCLASLHNDEANVSLNMFYRWLKCLLIFILINASIPSEGSLKAEFPERPITIVVAFGVGGSADRMSHVECCIQRAGAACSGHK